MVHQVRCKVFVMEEGQWRERGTGPIRVLQGRAKEEKGGARLGAFLLPVFHHLLLSLSFHDYLLPFCPL